MKILSLYLFFSYNCDAIKQAQLRDVKENLQAIELPVLYRVATHIELCKQG